MIGVVPYLTPDEPRWAPTDEAAITAAATAGLLVESHYLELKSTIPPGKGEIRELARDLASFAIDGLTLLIGLDESDDGGPPKPNPIELAGLAERVELVARTIPDPPIPVTCTPIASSEPGRGFLLTRSPPPAPPRTWLAAPIWAVETRQRSGSATPKSYGSTKPAPTRRTSQGSCWTRTWHGIPSGAASRPTDSSSRRPCARGPRCSSTLARQAVGENYSLR